MSDIDPSWTVLGRTDNATIHEAEDRVLLVAPDAGCTDDESTARQSLEFQRDHWARTGKTGAAIVLMDPVGHQTKEARKVYQDSAYTNHITGFALVTSSMFGRAVASVFMGLSRPPVPTKMFGDIESALRWARSRNAEADAG